MDASILGVTFFRLIVLMGWEQAGTKITITSTASQGIFGSVQDIIHVDLFLARIVLGWI